MINKILDKILSGRFLILMMFGFTLCLMSATSLYAVLFKDKTDDKFISLVTFFAGYLTGAFSKIWDSYSHRSDRTTEQSDGGKDEKSVNSNIPVVK